MATYKVVVSGPFNSGKTTFVRTISEIPVISTEKRISHPTMAAKADTTVALDYGRVSLDEDTVFLFGTPGQIRFEFMWEILAKDTDGLIILVDSTDPMSFPAAADMISYFAERLNSALLVVSNKTDLKGARRLSEMQHAMRLGDGFTIMPCVATSRSSSRQVLLQLLEIMRSASGQTGRDTR